MFLKYVAVLLLASLCQRALAIEKIKVSVYYESLCPDSIKFFTKQLYPTLQKNISQYIELDLIPYGKATQQFNTTLNQWEFTCHHGPDECYGNKVQACAIAHIPHPQPSPNGNGYNKITVAFINCLMDRVVKDPFSLPVKECATLNKVPNMVEIENCADHNDGTNLLSNLGHLTEKLSPKLTSVPTIVFNSMYKKEDNDMAQTNFVKALCGHIMHDKPAECQKNGASSLTSTFVALFVTVSSLLMLKSM